LKKVVFGLEREDDEKGRHRGVRRKHSESTLETGQMEG
jgi:hypothetical protein